MYIYTVWSNIIIFRYNYFSCTINTQPYYLYVWAYLLSIPCGSHPPSQWNASNIVAVCVNHPPACPHGLKNKQGHSMSSVWPFTHHPLCLTMPEQCLSHGPRPQRGSVCPLVEPQSEGTSYVVFCVLTGVAEEGGRTYTLWGNPFSKPTRLWKKGKRRKKKMISLLNGNSKQVPECAFVWCECARILYVLVFHVM